jgi:hypothetical protein
VTRPGPAPDMASLLRAIELAVRRRSPSWRNASLSSARASSLGREPAVESPLTVEDGQLEASL